MLWNKITNGCMHADSQILVCELRVFEWKTWMSNYVNVQIYRMNSYCRFETISKNNRKSDTKMLVFCVHEFHVAVSNKLVSLIIRLNTQLRLVKRCTRRKNSSKIMCVCVCVCQRVCVCQSDTIVGKMNV